MCKSIYSRIYLVQTLNGQLGLKRISRCQALEVHDLGLTERLVAQLRVGGGTTAMAPQPHIIGLRVKGQRQNVS